METWIELLKALLFGVVEGITEWLPISSTGHLILLDELVKLKVSPEFMDMFEVVIQLGAILAVILLFFHKLNPFAPSKSSIEKKDTWVLWLKVVIAIIPSGIIGVLLDDWMTAHLHTPVVVAAALILYGIAFLFLEKLRPQDSVRVHEVGQIDYKTAFLVGCFQVLSLIPGTSRSGSTILGGMLLGLSRGASAEFSFFMAIPTMVGASGIKALKFILSGTPISGLEWGVLGVAFLSAFLVSLVAIRFLMDFVKKHSFSAFGWYRIALGLLVLGWFFLF